MKTQDSVTEKLTKAVDLLPKFLNLQFVSFENRFYLNKPNLFTFWFHFKYEFFSKNCLHIEFSPIIYNLSIKEISKFMFNRSITRFMDDLAYDLDNLERE